MKILRTAILVFFILFAFACNNSKNKKDVKELSDVTNTTSDKSNPTNADYIDQDALQTIESVVKEILITSPHYIQLTKSLYEMVVQNGGTSYNVVLERSPNQNQDNEYIYSKTYDFAIYENYSDRQLITARFSFDPESKELYEYDPEYDQLNPIEFDRNLLLKFETLSK